MNLSDFTFQNKYSHIIKSENRKETWAETVQRNKLHNLKMLETKTPWVLDDTQFMDKFYEAYEYILDKKFLPSMRSIQFAGKAAELNEMRVYNCSYCPINTIESFSEICLMLLTGNGCGFSVQQHHIKQLPRIKKPSTEKKYLINDSIQGWAESVQVLIEAYLKGTYKPRFDFRDIREKGTDLITTGGKAPGSEPLKLALFLIEDLLAKKKIGSRLTSLECHSILCWIADSILSAGIRRSAMISFFSYWDKEMLNCKSGEWWLTNPSFGRSNNSVVLLRNNTSWEKVKSIFLRRFRRVNKKMFNKIFDACHNSFAGEPGFSITNNLEVLSNPCHEIALYPNQFCNLCDINGPSLGSQNDANRTAYYASFIASIQSLHTDFHYLNQNWIDQTEKERLIGIGVTGICGMKSNIDKKQMADKVLEANEYCSKLLRIPLSARTVCVKPAGTTSCVLECSSGIHSYHSEYYIRRVRLSANDPMVAYLKEKVPDLIELEVGKTDSYVVSFPMKAPEGAITRNNETALDILNRVYDWNINYIRRGHRSGDNYNNVSCTINVKDNEWEDVRRSMWDNIDVWTGISLLPFDGGSYVQAPFEEITEEEYNRWITYIESRPKVNFSEVVYLEDNTDYDLACSGGLCDIKMPEIEIKINLEGIE